MGLAEPEGPLRPSASFSVVARPSEAVNNALDLALRPLKLRLEKEDHKNWIIVPRENRHITVQVVGALPENAQGLLPGMNFQLTRTQIRNALRELTRDLSPFKATFLDTLYAFNTGNEECPFAIHAKMDQSSCRMVGMRNDLVQQFRACGLKDFASYTPHMTLIWAPQGSKNEMINICEQESIILPPFDVDELQLVHVVPSNDKNHRITANGLTGTFKTDEVFPLHASLESSLIA